MNSNRTSETQPRIYLLLLVYLEFFT